MSCYLHRWETQKRWVCQCGAVAESTDFIYSPCVLCGAPGANAAGLCPTCQKRANTITEVERTAISLLWGIKGDIVHPKTADYVNHVIAVPEFSDGPDVDTFPNPHDEAMYPTEDNGLSYHIDRAASLLASGIARYRAEGRPSGDQAVEIGAGYHITTSLAANIVEYHAAMLNAYATARRFDRIDAKREKRTLADFVDIEAGKDPPAPQAMRGYCALDPNDDCDNDCLNCARAARAAEKEVIEEH